MIVHKSETCEAAVRYIGLELEVTGLTDAYKVSDMEMDGKVIDVFLQVPGVFEAELAQGTVYLKIDMEDIEDYGRHGYMQLLEHTIEVTKAMLLLSGHINSKDLMKTKEVA